MQVFYFEVFVCRGLKLCYTVFVLVGRKVDFFHAERIVRTHNNNIDIVTERT